MQRLVILFSSEQSAAHLVAGVPAAARVLHAVSMAEEQTANHPCILALPGGKIENQFCHAEIARLAPEILFEIVDSNSFEPGEKALLIDGVSLPDAALLAAAMEGDVAEHAALPGTLGNWKRNCACLTEIEQYRRLDAAGWDMLRATVKPGDGIVSRHINRPISLRMSRFLLRFGGMRPIHATLAAAACGIAMAWSLFFGGAAGVVAGGLLFQAASIIDGVDGEMARATFRSSNAGATLDSVIDSLTNLLFFAGLTFNVWQQGAAYAGVAGIAGFSSFAIGLALLGRHGYQTSRSINFEAVKHYFRGRPKRTTQSLIWLTTRDFFCAASCVFAVVGLATPLLYLFSAIALIWLAVVVVVLIKVRDRNPDSL
jgi:1L-myo-inositol 1-phosphate cytidylyltransferase / CDP-L-myo-inositol myo-inositolphosphotransferase